MSFSIRFLRLLLSPRLVAEPSPSAEYKKHIAQFYFHYAMLVLNSFGLQNALERSPTNIGHFFARCHSSATAVATLVRDQLGPSGYMRYSPDSHFVQTSYAVLSLLKVCPIHGQSSLRRLLTNSLHSSSALNFKLSLTTSRRLSP